MGGLGRPWVWAPGWLFFVPLLLLLFPDGQLPSPRWRPAIWAAFGAAALIIAGAWLDPNPNSQPTYHNPTATHATAWLANVGELVGWWSWSRPPWHASPGSCCGSAAAGASSASRSSGSHTPGSPPSSCSRVTPSSPLLRCFTPCFVGAILLPVAIGFAILKYRLYDIDVVISKTIVYGSLAAFITAVYVLVVVGIGSLGSGSLHAGSRPNLALSILATAVVAVAFQPVRERVQRLANRLVFGKRATPYEALSEFAGRMGGTYAAEDVLPRMARVLAEGTGADRAVVWLKDGAELAAGACWPADGAPPGPVGFAGGGAPAITGADRVALVYYQGEALGALSVAKRPGETLTPVEGKLMSDLAAQAGLLLRNIGLTEQLRARLADLQASRLRIVAAADDQRRRIERDIHDGAQQQLLAIADTLALARVAGRPGRAAGTGAGRPAQGRDQRRAGDAARTRPRHLPAAARRPGPAPPPSAPRPARHPGRSRSAPTVSAGTRPRSKPPSTSAAWKPCTTPPGTRRDRRYGSAWPTPGTAPSSRSPTTAPASTRPPRRPGRDCGT